MDCHQRKALQKMHKAFCDTLQFDADLEANFVQCGLFPDDKLDDIKAENTNMRRIQRMLKELKCRGPTAFDKFVICIKDRYPWLADQLQACYHQEVNNIAPSSADIALQRKVELFVQNKFRAGKILKKQDKQEISSFLLFHVREQQRLFPGDNHSEHPEQENHSEHPEQENHSEHPEHKILQKVFSLLTNEKINVESTESIPVPGKVSLNMIESEINKIFQQLRRLETQVDYYKDVSDKFFLEKQKNEIKLKEAQNEIARLEIELQQSDRIIHDKSKRLQEMNSQLQDLKIICQMLKQKHYRHQYNKLSMSDDFEWLSHKLSDIMHEEAPINSKSCDLINEVAPNISPTSRVPKNWTKFPNIHPEFQNLPQKKRGSQSKMWKY